MFLETLVGSSKLLPITVYEGIWTIQAISQQKNLPNSHQLKHIALKNWARISPKTNTQPTAVNFRHRKITSEVLMWCPMVERRWDPIRYTSFRSHRHSGGGMGFRKSLKCKKHKHLGKPNRFLFYTSNNFSDFGFSGLSIFSSKNLQMRWSWEWLSGKESSGNSETTTFPIRDAKRVSTRMSIAKRIPKF